MTPYRIKSQSVSVRLRRGWQRAGWQWNSFRISKRKPIHDATKRRFHEIKTLFQHLGEALPGQKSSGRGKRALSSPLTWQQKTSECKPRAKLELAWRVDSGRD